MIAVDGMRVALVGFTGVGKTTIAQALLVQLRDAGHAAELVKLAAPLYRLQRIYYEQAGVDLAPGVQDQELMVEIATRLRAISAHALLDAFLTTVSALPTGTAVVNDDLREPDPDAAGLISAGFRVVRLQCSPEVRRGRLADRGDQSVIDEPAILGPAMARIPAELVLDTSTATPAEAVRRILTHLAQTTPGGIGA